MREVGGKEEITIIIIITILKKMMKVKIIITITGI